jgi:ethanolamine ammonia-lyase small subunit
VIQDFADSIQLPDGSTNIHVVTVYVDDSLQADAIGNATNDQRSNVEPIFSQQGLTDIRRQLMRRIGLRRASRGDKSSHEILLA